MLTVAIPCLSVAQRVRFTDSLNTLHRVRLGARLLATSVDTASRAANVARRAATGFANSLVAQQRLTTDASAQATNWKRKARRRGLLNFLLLAVASGFTYLSVR